MTWARAAGDPSYTPQGGGYYFSPGEMQDQLTYSYADLAQQSPNGLLACAGEAFRRAIEQYPGIVLQQTDFSHPTVTPAPLLLAACTFYVALTGQEVPAQSFVPSEVSAQDAASLRDIAQVRGDEVCGRSAQGVRVGGATASGNGQQPIIFPNPDGGSEFESPFDFGTAGSLPSPTTSS